jgi:predicted amidohydrolase YtcJ
MIITGAEIGPDRFACVRVRDGFIVAVARHLDAEPHEPRIDARGCVLLPGLHDHHMHLLALAASRASLQCGPPDIASTDELARALRAAGTTRPACIRGVGYHEGVGPAIDRNWLDRICHEIPVRIQHRSGRLWILNSAALLQIPRQKEWPEGVEKDEAGRLTGRFYHLDGWLRQQLPRAVPSLEPVSLELASYGVTGVTDAGPDNDGVVLDLLEAAHRSGELRQRVLLMGASELPFRRADLLETGARKIYLRESELPAFDELCAAIRETHVSGRNVAFHCVTPSELQFALTAMQQAGVLRGDRIEHASIADDAAIVQIAELGLTVVTQPNFIFERGDQYLQQVEPRDRPVLYRGAGFIRGGAGLAAGTDAPFGDPDPWLAIRSARARRTRSGASLAPHEALDGERALSLFLGEPRAPSHLRRVGTGGVADLCLLRGGWREVLGDATSERVGMTIRGGTVIWQR